MATSKNFFARHVLSKPCLLFGKPPLGFDKPPPPFSKKRRVFYPKRGGCFGVKVGGVLLQKGRVFFKPTSRFSKVWPKDKILCALYRPLDDIGTAQKHLSTIHILNTPKFNFTHTIYRQLLKIPHYRM